MSQASAAKPHPITKRMDRLTRLWNEFAQRSEPRLLRWVVPADDHRLLEVFFDRQNEPVSRIPDLFVVLRSPFGESSQYADALLQDFLAQFEEARPRLKEMGLRDDWVPPQVQRGSTPLQTLVRCWTSFREAYEGLLLQLVIVLSPPSITDGNAWSGWLRNLLRTALPGSVRVTLVDPAESPLLETLSRDEPVLVASVAPELDMPTAMRELARGAGKSSPGDRFRMLFVEMLGLASKGDMPKMKAKASSALRIADQQNWPHLGFVIHMALAATHMGAKRPEEALAGFRAAFQAAGKAQANGEASAPKLLVQSRFGEGATLLGAGKPLEAAQVYGEAAVIALEGKDAYHTMEAWRMAAYCHQQGRQPAKAWTCYWQSLDAAEGMDLPTRQASTLPYAGRALLELTRSSPYKREADRVRTRMQELAGEDWESKLAGGAASS